MYAYSASSDSAEATLLYLLRLSAVRCGGAHAHFEALCDLRAHLRASAGEDELIVPAALHAPASGRRLQRDSRAVVQRGNGPHRLPSRSAHLPGPAGRAHERLAVRELARLPAAPRIHVAPVRVERERVVAAQGDRHNLRVRECADSLRC